MTFEEYTSRVKTPILEDRIMSLQDGFSQIMDLMQDVCEDSIPWILREIDRIATEKYYDEEEVL